jgi:uncharacterized protein YndB with AHSA1/START domain
MTIQPIRHQVTVQAPPIRAFELFTGRMGAWWPKGKTVGERPHADIIIEPRAGGRWFERDETGAEMDWGRVNEFAPPGRLLLAWQLDAEFKYDPSFSTAVELTFEATGEGTRVTLEHRDLERFGEAAEKIAGQLNGGWPTLLGQYAADAQAQITASPQPSTLETQA